jgi:hypothetical protein
MTLEYTTSEGEFAAEFQQQRVDLEDSLSSLVLAPSLFLIGRKSS